MESCPHIRGLKSVKSEALFTPRMWLCSECGTTESVWACLQCSNIACGRFNEEHAFKHFREKGRPPSQRVSSSIGIPFEYVPVADLTGFHAFCSYQCDGYVFNDNCHGEIALIRERLKEIETQIFNESLTRSGHVIRRASSPVRSEENKIDKEHARLEDKLYTAVCHWRLSLLSRVFGGLRENVRLYKEEKSNGQAKEIQQEKKEEPPKKRRKVIIPGVTGLRNLGNTCYMNSVLQVLSHLQFFRHCFLLLNVIRNPELPCLTSTPKNRRSLSAVYTRQTTVECYEHISMPLRKEHSWPKRRRDQMLVSNAMENNNNNTDKLEDCSLENSATNTTDVEQNKQVLFSDELHALFRVMWSGKWAIVTPLAVLHAVWHLIPSFLGYSQHDAQEFLCEMLERLQSELEKHGPMNFQSPLPDVIHPKDILPNAFEGKLVSEVMCHNCRGVSKTCEQFWDLSLEFPDRYQVKPRSTRGRLPPRRPSMDSCHLTELLSKFTHNEMLEGRSYRCEKCSVSSPDTLQFAQKQLQIAELPEVLRLHLKRFRWYCQTRGKIVSHVQFDVELDMKPYCHQIYFQSYSDHDFLYKLSGVIIHLGTGFDAGHYVAYCWNEQAGSWVHYNDARVSLCTEQEVLRAQAYILLYTRSNGRTAQTNLCENFVLPKSP